MKGFQGEYMRKTVFLLSGALALQLVAGPVMAAEKKEAVVPKGPSFHVQCDGSPNNMSSGESAARLLGAVTLLGIFAPPPESADPKARKFGKEGADACSQVLVGEKTEGNLTRRIELIQARALHQIEAKDYDAALADVALARREAAAAGFDSDPLYRRSTGLGMDQIEAAAYLRQDKVTEAVTASLRQYEGVKHQYIPMLLMHSFPEFVKPGNEAIGQVERHYQQMLRLSPDTISFRANWMGELGRFADAARLREAAIDIQLAFKPEQKPTYNYASAALEHALAGDWAKAEARAADARQNDKDRVAAGKAEESRSGNAEILDLYEVLKLHRDGNVASARRMFTGRSAWLVPSLGAVMEANRRLLPGATADERIATLGKTADQLWDERKAAEIAELQSKDADNKTLFYLPNGASRSANWESYSKQVWNVKKKSKMLLEPDEKNGIIVGGFSDIYGNVYAKFDALLLHTALTAREKGHSHFYFNPVMAKDGYSYAQIRFGKAGEPGLPADVVLTPEPVIAELSALIPPPDVLKAKKAAASKKKTN
jgi:CheY-like chemotaxis protein